MILDKLVELLQCAEEQIDVPVCRTFINPGPDAPHDVCSKQRDGSDGQMWVGHLFSNEGWPVPTGLPTTCAAPFADQIEIGIVRCAAKVNDQGEAPPADEVTADAYQQQADRIALRNAIQCCWSVDNLNIVIIDWTAIPPTGGCVGGVWTLSVRDGGCNCGNLES